MKISSKKFLFILSVSFATSMVASVSRAEDDPKKNGRNTQPEVELKAGTEFGNGSIDYKGSLSVYDNERGDIRIYARGEEGSGKDVFFTGVQAIISDDHLIGEFKAGLGGMNLNGDVAEFSSEFGMKMGYIFDNKNKILSVLDVSSSKHYSIAHLGVEYDARVSDRVSLKPEVGFESKSIKINQGTDSPYAKLGVGVRLGN